MSTSKITADWIYNLGSEKVIVFDENGSIRAIDELDDHDPASVKILSGTLVPGYVNAHCHLELSHLKGILPSGTGLVKFIEGVVSLRGEKEGHIKSCIEAADREMYAQGIVAVGDISNKTDTFKCKDESPIYYHTFVEMFDFMQPQLAAKIFEEYLAVFETVAPSAGHTCSAVPHAPYSVSEPLFKAIGELNASKTSVSIHNQETADETELFQSGGGQLADFFAKIGFPYGDTFPAGHSSLSYALSQMNAHHHTLLVHNTQSDAEDIALAHAWSNKIFWVTCPNANLYIENSLPEYQHFIDAGAKVCIGTDSLSSNWQLSIFEEMKVIKKYGSFIPSDTLIAWATTNGAEALGVDDRFGSIEVGKAPGLNLITTDNQGEIWEESTSIKII
ncbi:MAG: amidohydrolase family protein [Saprospiraceae bacterium]|nr:amidohydrolase family protein [Saprospiraceae bacterium]